jgi:choline-sulfatase
VAYADAMVGKLLADLRSAGQLDRTLVTVLADHGESLGEHGERTHGVFTYESTMRVPWIIWARGRDSRSGVRDSVTANPERIPIAEPRIPSGSSDALVRLTDLAPTTLDLVGIPAPPEFEGRSVIPALNKSSRAAPETGGRVAYIEAMDANLTRNWAPLTGVVTHDYKLIDLPIPELYDLRVDPGETANLFARDAERARTLESLLRAEVSAFQAKGSAAEQTTLTADARQRLQALGYVASSAAAAARVYTEADDPKTLIGPANDLQRAVGAFNSGSRAQAMTAVHAIMQQHPRFATAFGMFASMQRQSGDLRGAIATLEDIVRRGLADQSVMVVLAAYLQDAGDVDKAVGLLEAVAAAHPDYAEAYNSLGVIFTRLGRHDRSRLALRRVLELDPTSAKAYENLAADELSAHEIEPAITDLRRALDLEPHLYDALCNLALALEASGRHQEAGPHLERFMREAPPSRYGREIAEFQKLLETKK